MKERRGRWRRWAEGRAGCEKIKIWEGDQGRREINRERKKLGIGKGENNERKVMEEEGK